MKNKQRRSKTKIFLNKLWVRIYTAWWVITHPKAHWVLINITKDNLINLIQEKPLEELDLTYHGLVNYNIYMICKNIHESRDEIDYILDKAQFEANAIERTKQ
jgi:hypothetical protein